MNEFFSIINMIINFFLSQINIIVGWLIENRFYDLPILVWLALIDLIVSLLSYFDFEESDNV